MICSKEGNRRHESRNGESVRYLLHGIRNALHDSSNGTRSVAGNLTSGRSNGVWQVRNLTDYLPRDAWRTSDGDSIHNATNRCALDCLADWTWEHCNRRERCRDLRNREATLRRMFSSHRYVSIRVLRRSRNSRLRYRNGRPNHSVVRIHLTSGHSGHASRSCHWRRYSCWGGNWRSRKRWWSRKCWRREREGGRRLRCIRRNLTRRNVGRGKGIPLGLERVHSESRTAFFHPSEEHGEAVHRRKLTSGPFSRLVVVGLVRLTKLEATSRYLHVSTSYKHVS